MEVTHIMAERLTEARQFAGLSTGQIAHMLGIPCVDVERIERGEGEISDATLRQLTQCYGASADYLSGGDAPPIAPDVQVAIDQSRMPDADKAMLLRFVRFLDSAGPLSQRATREEQGNDGLDT